MLDKRGRPGQIQEVLRGDLGPHYYPVWLWIFATALYGCEFDLRASAFYEGDPFTRWTREKWGQYVKKDLVPLLAMAAIPKADCAAIIRAIVGAEDVLAFRDTDAWRSFVAAAVPPPQRGGGLAASLRAALQKALSKGRQVSETTLHKNGDDLAIVTTAETEMEFLEQYSAALAKLIESGEYAGDWSFQITNWTTHAFEIMAKYRGYKSQVVEERRLTAGHLAPDGIVAAAGRSVVSEAEEALAEAVS